MAYVTAALIGACLGFCAGILTMGWLTVTGIRSDPARRLAEQLRIEDERERLGLPRQDR